MLNHPDEYDSRQPAETSLRTSLSNGKNKDAFDEHLLRLVFARPPLYNYSLPIEERALSISNKLWKEVADELAPTYGPIDIERLKSGYKYHRNRYTRYRSAVAKMEIGFSPQQASSKIHVPKHIKILCKLGGFNKYSKANVVISKSRTTAVSTNVCRTCLIENSDTESIFSMQLVNNEFVKVSHMISMCTGLEFSKYDNFPNVICRSCINSVILAFEFRSKCWESHTFEMQKLLKRYEPVPRRTDTKPQPSPSKKKKMVEFITKSEINYKLKEHVDITLDHTVYRGKRYKCRHCEQKYLAAHLMIDHLENIHKFNIKPEAWKARRRYKDKTIICQHCGITIPKSRFADHYRRHTGEKPFKCDTCDFRSAYLSSMKKHKLTHTGEKPVICHICGQTYRTASQRAVHMRSHSNETPFKCVICKKGFKRNDILKEHMQTHEPSKLYECEICKRKFSRRGPLRFHMMQHTGRRPHKCSECGKGFIQRHCWRTHMKNHHKITVQ